MKVLLTPESKTSIKKYPYIGKSRVNGVIILFNDLNAGTIMYDPNEIGYEIGYYHDDWDERKFENFNGNITFSN